MTQLAYVDLAPFFASHPALQPLLIPSTVGAGWALAVRSALEQLDALAIELQPSGIEIQVVQVKEKFGDLRIAAFARRLRADADPADPDEDARYESESPDVAAATKRIRVIAQAAEAATRSVCETCGAPTPEIRLQGGWMMRRCDACVAALSRPGAASI